MPRSKNTGTINGEVPKPDFEMAGRIHRNDIAPANKEQKRAMKDASDGWKAVKKEAHVNVAGFRAAMRVADMEEAEQQTWLRSFNGGLKERNVTLSYDLVDQAEGKDRGAGAEVVPIGEARAPQLATIPGDDSDLAGGADNDAHTGDEDLHAAE